jgi:ABC-type tungstate transport system permease subunit
VKNIKLNPFIRDFDAIRDEKLECIIGKNEWTEVKESDWKRLSEAQTKQGDSLLPTFIAEGDGMGEVKSLVSEKETIDEEWFGTDEEVEEEE